MIRFYQHRILQTGITHVQNNMSKIIGTQVRRKSNKISKRVLNRTHKAKQNTSLIIRNDTSLASHREYFLKKIPKLLKNMVKEQGKHGPGFRMLILTCHRERAYRMGRVLQEVLDELQLADKIKWECVVSTQSFEREIDNLDFELPEIVIATRGRLEKHLENSDYFRNLKYFVVDEPDSFIFEDSLDKELKLITAQMNPRHATTLLSSVEVEPTIWRKSAPLVKINNFEPRSDIQRHKATFTNYRELLESLHDHLSQNKHKKIAVICNNNTLVMAINEIFRTHNLYCTALSRLSSQKTRNFAMAYLEKRTNGITLSTDSILFGISEFKQFDEIIDIGPTFNNRPYPRLLNMIKENGSFTQLALENESAINAEATERTFNKSTFDQEKIDPLLQKDFRTAASIASQFFQTYEEQEALDRLSQVLPSLSKELKMNVEQAQHLNRESALRNLNLVRWRYQRKKLAIPQDLL